MFAEPGAREPAYWARMGDSAIWSGHYVAAEAFRYAVTGDPEALANAERVLTGIHRLVTLAENWTAGPAAGAPIAGAGERGLLLRHCAPEAAAPFLRDEGRVAIDSRDGRWLCLHRVSRDQYVGVALGLAVTLLVLPDGPVRARAGEDAVSIARYLLRHAWTIVEPGETGGESFLPRPDMALAILAVAARAAPEEFRAAYVAHAAAVAAGAWVPPYVETFQAHEDYYKFNLDHANAYVLASLENEPLLRERYLAAIAALRRTLGTHGNAHFDAIAFALSGEPGLDARAARELGEWLDRPRPKPPVDHRAACGVNFACVPESYADVVIGPPAAGARVRWASEPCAGALRAAAPLPIVDRPYTDFLWQRSPFQLSGGERARVLSPGIDYLLPYWMLRYATEVAPPTPRALPESVAPAPNAGGGAIAETPVICLPR